MERRYLGSVETDDELWKSDILGSGRIETRNDIVDKQRQRLNTQTNNWVKHITVITVSTLSWFLTNPEYPNQKEFGKRINVNKGHRVY
jgi:hypothetical protein